MSTYSLIAKSEALAHRLVANGGTGMLYLSREHEALNAGLCVEPLGQTLEAVISMAGTTSSITLQTDDAANAQHLCDYIEALANGTAETATEAPSGAKRCCGDCEELKADLYAQPTQSDVTALMPDSTYFTLTFQQDAKLRRLICEGGETVLPLGEGAALAVVVDPDQSAAWQARIRTVDADLQVRLPADPARAHQNLIEHVEGMADAYRWTHDRIAA
ncbi:hypothetical protein [Pseudomonas kuykendallii]|uniref:hypothetical protein n=1 Tax=Pseudomonas kuykendallii TaxID=1007099 RepID=UPI0028D04F49|nr:hypothetical protein [Pseudomonas kuykendallii]